MNQYQPPYVAPEFRVFGISAESLRLGLLWLLFATSFLVIIEPAPSELIFVVLLFTCLFGGVTFHPLIAPLLLLLIFYNLGGVISLQQPLFERGRAIQFVVISTYMGFSAILLAALVAYRPLQRINIINTAWIIGATLGSVLAVMGFFDIAGTAERFTLFGRAMGAFKDPNVYSTYIIYPMVVALTRLLTGQTRHPFATGLAFSIMLAGLFLAFSRGAYLVFIGASLLATLLTFMFVANPRLRARIVFLSAFGFALGAVVIVTLLAIPDVRDLFLVRISPDQSYDVGETGRFGRQLRALPKLLMQPLGFGPLQFARYFGEDPHNTFLNAFSAYSWLGGISYTALIIITLWISSRTIATHSSVRQIAIPVFATLFMLILQGVQIDTDHWRHFYWLLGMMWGLFIAKEMEHRSQARQNAWQKV